VARRTIASAMSRTVQIVLIVIAILIVLATAILLVSIVDSA
jgi:hypothetical protein